MTRILTALIVSFSLPASAASVKQAFSEARHFGAVRAYNNTLALQHAPDKYGTAVGGKLGIETKAEHLWGVSLGATYMTANDLSTNHEDTAARAPYTPTVDVDILGEAFVRYTGHDSVFTAGRQLITTPHANPSDAFVVPISFTGYSLINKSVENLTLQADYLMSIKTRESQSFVNTGTFIRNRLAVGTASETKGTTILGGVWDKQPVKLQAWYYNFADMFNMGWLEGEYVIQRESYSPYIGAHFGHESDTGDKLLGDVDSKLVGAKIGAKGHGADLSFAFEQISTGTFYSPYTYFTDAAYTNSMITGPSNVDNGQAWKTMLTYDFNPQLWGKLSHSRFMFDNGKDFSESDFDIRYTFSKESDWTGFSAWFRVGYRDGSNIPTGYADLIEYRTQLQYVF